MAMNLAQRKRPADDPNEGMASFLSAIMLSNQHFQQTAMALEMSRSDRENKRAREADDRAREAEIRAREAENRADERQRNLILLLKGLSESKEK